jgi:hypothetical protein
LGPQESPSSIRFPIPPNFAAPSRLNRK